jgi:putative transposase
MLRRTVLTLQGSHFTSPQYTQRLLAADIQISIDGKGRALDNIFTERLWRTIKYEEVYLHDYQTPKQARTGLAAYLDFSNYRRPHQSLSYLTPAKVYFANTMTIPDGMSNPQQLLL